MIFRTLLVLFMLMNFLNCASLLTYNFYSRNDYFDIVLSFNEAYNGQIRQQNTNDKTTLFLENVELKEDFSQNYNLDFIKNISFLNTDDNALQIEIKSTSQPIITASKSPDKLGMRIKIAKKQVENFSSLGAQKDTNLDNNYVSVIVVLGILALVLFFIKRRILNKKNTPKANAEQIHTEPVKFSKNDDFATIAENFGIKNKKNESVKTLFEKALDEQNKVMLLEHENRRYLVLVGSSNVILDRFGEDGIYTPDDFELFFAKNKEKLMNYISTHQNSLENYKNRLSQD